MSFDCFSNEAHDFGLHTHITHTSAEGRLQGG